MPPEGYSFWDQLMQEQGVALVEPVSDYAQSIYAFERTNPNYNVGDVIVGEIVVDA